MRELKSSIIHSLCDQIFTSSIHWPKATNFSETATHAIDLGPGGLSGIRSLIPSRKKRRVTTRFISLVTLWLPQTRD